MGASMKDGLGRVQSVLLVGGTSEIGLAIVRALDRGTLRRVVLAGRDRAGLDRAAESLRPGPTIEIADFEALDPDGHRALFEAVAAAGDIDVVVVAAGILGDQDQAEADPDLAVRTLQANVVGAGSAAMHAAAILRRQGHGELVILSSVAAVRPRRANYVYGASKAGLDALGRGIAEALRGSGARAIVVRPGFVRTRMTEGMAEAPFATDPAAVAEVVASALRGRRTVVYAPAILAPVMGVLSALPQAVFRRLPG